ncbi:hypothetical protein EVJ58_g8495 [Rhodofomes roseus]|uniref:Uncharacterized protein n=1 Tax=Rhodofomes roseus TaxID=34475 RepID=A0A4Y9XZD5_9APHY|nr:hypothetical protein EVJ58_g8495 [Rhodofomes roseus]
MASRKQQKKSGKLTAAAGATRAPTRAATGVSAPPAPAAAVSDQLEDSGKTIDIDPLDWDACQLRRNSCSYCSQTSYPYFYI